jgi:hypothetical protein
MPATVTYGKFFEIAQRDDFAVLQRQLEHRATERRP